MFTIRVQIRSVIKYLNDMLRYQLYFTFVSLTFSILFRHPLQYDRDIIRHACQITYCIA